MKRNYLPVTVVVIVLGVGLSLIPHTVELSQPYEMETLYNQTETTKASVDGEVQEFMFRTGRVDTVDGFSPTLILTNSADENINATVVNLDHPGTINAFVNESQSVIVYQVEEADSYDLKINGWVRADMQVEVTATFIYYSHTPPERYTYYPYRYFGLGMASVGIVTSVIAAYYNEKAARLPE
jgi:hypothetical protein